MCGIVGVVSNNPVNQLLYDALLLLQHRGQDAAGIATSHGNKFAMHKANGLVKDVFRTRNMRSLPGNVGIGQVRYPTAGSTSEEEAQPFYVNAPFGIVLAHNGNLTNAAELKIELFKNDMRHLNTDSDSEVLLNILAHQIQEVTSGYSLDPAALFRAVAMLHRRVRGSYAVVAHIAGYGLLAFRDPYGIRPLCLGISRSEKGTEYMLASESVALEGLGFKFVRDVEPGEAIFIDVDGQMFNEQCAENPTLNPCAFEYVYLARPDSIIDGASVYLTRLKMGEYLAEKVRSQISDGEIDVVMPIPDSSRPSAMELALKLNLNYREGFIKNRYIGRTFMMPGQAIRKKSVRQKLNAIGSEFKGKSVLLVDDSIVRGTTSREIVQMARESGARRVIFASAAPPVQFPNVYGIDMPTRSELIAYGRSIDEVCREITADALVYQDVDAMKRSISDVNPALRSIEASCFDGHYITGDVTSAYLDRLEAARNSPRPDTEDILRSQLNLNLAGTD
ncbi:amidophosphoribosyltransferase [Undibacterium parvum]|jgi:amidophosphoribosyltransferase|uniref:Amidophosphoribosyltransferase n=1 Tax=Undibacterium parvum TaxID=401471 RepID=A0A3S9HNS4_9BURK|nr:amidophosphoribosyltransferase [Undibacterium parvum]AZP13734.1 amidophosphoribosyltransferase [Undibacterium parvum]MCX7219785.1 amidophosphoribosyltransferase [Burkholderiales bacterium]